MSDHELAGRDDLPALTAGDKEFIDDQTAADLADYAVTDTTGLIVGYWRATNNDQPAYARKLKAAVEATGNTVETPLAEVVVEDVKEDNE